jgi:hypothetical protein
MPGFVMPDSTDTTTAAPSRPRGLGAGRPGTVRLRPSFRTGSFEIFTYPHHSPAARALGAVWRWRVELLCVLALIIAWVVVAYQLPASWPTWTVAVILAAIIALIGVVPWSRRLVIRRVWCVFSRHRVRKCFVQSRVMTHEGLLPLFMWTRPTPVGDRLWLWLRPGLSGRDIEAVSDRIAAACWASEARVRVSAKRAAIVSVEVIRRDPLASPGRLQSPLLQGVARAHFDSDADVIPLPDRSTVIPAKPVASATPLDDPPAPVDPARAMRGGATKRTGTRTPAPTKDDESSVAAVVGWSGKDVSDYV